MKSPQVNAEGVRLSIRSTYDMESISTGISGINEQLIWSGGLATLGHVENQTKDVHFFKNRYYLINLLLICSSAPLSKEATHPEGNFFLAYLTNKRCPLLKTLVFSLLNSVLTYDCDGYLFPYANHIQRNRYVDLFYRSTLELALVLLQHKPKFGSEFPM